MAFRRGCNRRTDADGEVQIEVPLLALERGPAADDARLDRLETLLDDQTEEIRALRQELAKEREARIDLEAAVQHLRKGLDDLRQEGGRPRDREAEQGRPFTRRPGKPPHAPRTRAQPER